MGARKRAAEREGWAKWRREQDVGYTIEQCMRAARARYRIGERLRPCKGCFACTAREVSNFDGEVEIHYQSGEVAHQASESNPLYSDTRMCDGSGVMPAKA